MSCVCASCREPVVKPNALWYLAVDPWILIHYVCGKCLDKIPPGARRPTREQVPFTATFGPLAAEANAHGECQTSEARQLDPEFWVATADLERALSAKSDLLRELYPLLHTERYLRDLLKAEEMGAWDRWPGDDRPRDAILTEYGRYFRRRLGFPSETETEDRSGQERAAAELWRLIQEWAGRPA